MKNAKKKTICPQRGTFGDELNKALAQEGKWGSIMDYVRKNRDKYDVQVRANYLNIYYNGGNILCIKPRSLSVDEFYFHLDVTGDRKTRKTIIQENAKKGVEEAKEIINKLQKQKEDYLRSIKEGYAKPDVVKQYFENMSKQMDKWEKKLFDVVVQPTEKEKLPEIEYPERDIYHKEKFIQQKISLTNHSFDRSDLIILDVEFAVSDLAKYSSDNYTHPRFDMIAVDRDRRIHVLELKYGLNATGIDNPGVSASDIEGHVAKFQATVGGDNYKDFINDIRVVVSAKRDLELLNFEISDEKPIFDIVYAEPSEGNKEKVIKFIKDKVNNEEIKVKNIWLINTLKGYNLTNKNKVYEH